MDYLAFAKPWTADKIRFLRRRLCLKQGPFAALLDVSKATITSWERSKLYPTLEHHQALTKIAEQNNVEIFLENNDMFQFRLAVIDLLNETQKVYDPKEYGKHNLKRLEILAARAITTMNNISWELYGVRPLSECENDEYEDDYKKKAGDS